MDHALWDDAKGDLKACYRGEHAYVIEALKTVDVERAKVFLDKLPDTLECSRDIESVAATLKELRCGLVLGVRNMEVLVGALLEGLDMHVLVPHMNGYVYAPLMRLFQACALACRGQEPQFDARPCDIEGCPGFQYTFVIGKHEQGLTEHSLAVYTNSAGALQCHIEAVEATKRYVFSCAAYCASGKACMSIDYTCYLFFLMGAASHASFEDFDDDDRERALVFATNLKQHASTKKLMLSFKSNAFDLETRHFIHQRCMKQHPSSAMCLLAVVSHIRQLRHELVDLEKRHTKCLATIHEVVDLLRLQGAACVDTALLRLQSMVDVGMDLKQQYLHARSRMEALRGVAPTATRLHAFLDQHGLDEMLAFSNAHV